MNGFVTGDSPLKTFYLLLEMSQLQMYNAHEMGPLRKGEARGGGGGARDALQARFFKVVEKAGELLRSRRGGGGGGGGGGAAVAGWGELGPSLPPELHTLAMLQALLARQPRDASCLPALAPPSPRGHPAARPSDAPLLWQELVFQGVTWMQA